MKNKTKQVLSTNSHLTCKGGWVTNSMSQREQVGSLKGPLDHQPHSLNSCGALERLVESLPAENEPPSSLWLLPGTNACLDNLRLPSAYVVATCGSSNEVSVIQAEDVCCNVLNVYLRPSPTQATLM